MKALEGLSIIIKALSEIKENCGVYLCVIYLLNIYMYYVYACVGKEWKAGECTREASPRLLSARMKEGEQMAERVVGRRSGAQALSPI